MPHKNLNERREYERRRREAIRNDPERLEHQRRLNREAARRRYKKDPEKHRDAHRRWQRSNPGAKESARFKNLYGITTEDYEAMLERQGGVCAICSRPERVKDKRSNTGVRRLAVDHDHDTGEVRGLLCWSCNTGLAKFDEDPGLLSRASEYLNASR